MRLFPVSAFPLRTVSTTIEQITFPVSSLLSMTSASGAIRDFRVFDLLSHVFTVVLSEFTSRLTAENNTYKNIDTITM